jgi:dephospho-CoA kinase
MPPPVVGIIGGIGSGKSLVAAEFAAHGGHLIVADQLGHQALRQPAVKAQIVARWGNAVLDATGEIDRKRLAAIVFADANERKTLEAMTHPVIGQRIREEIAQARCRPEVRLIVLDAAVMLEAGWHGVCDHLVFVDAPREMRLGRLTEKRGWALQELEKRERAQMPVDEKRRHADAIVDNSGAPAEVAGQVQRLMARWGLPV